MYKFFCAITLLLCFVGCDKDEVIITPPNGNTNNNDTAILSTLNLNLNDAELVIVNVSNYTVTNDTYNAKFGDTEISMIKVDNESLAFIVPADIPSGDYELAVDFTENTLLFSITKTELTNTPNEILSAFVGDFSNDIQSAIDLYDSPNAVPLALIEAEANLNNALSEFNNLNDEDKLIAAKFIANFTNEVGELELAAKNVLTADVNLTSKTNSNCDASCAFFNIIKVLSGALLPKLAAATSPAWASIAAITIGVDVALSVIFNKNSYLLSLVWHGIKKVLDIAYFAQNYLSEVVFDAIDNTFFNKNSKNTPILSNGIPIQFKVKPTYRTLNPEDENANDSTIKIFINLYKKTTPLWDNYFKDTYGALPTFNTNETQVTAESISQFNIEVTGNADNVSVSEITGNPEEFNVTFNTEADTNQDFDFTITFTDGEVTAQQTINATLKVGGFDLSGLWKTEYLSNPPCNAINASTANFAFNNRELTFEAIDDTNGNVDRSFYLDGAWSEALEVNEYEYNPSTNELKIIMNSNGQQFGTDTLTREFSYTGILNENTQTFEGDFNYTLTIKTRVAGITSTSRKNCSGTMKLYR